MTALIVEDDPTVCLLFEQQLRSFGYEITSCMNAKTALENCRHLFYSLIVLDLESPDMDGLELCRQFRSLPQGNQSTILVMTEGEQPENLQAAIKAGADDYLTKPISIEQLNARLMIIERQRQNLAHRELFDDVNDLIQQTSADGKFIYVNRAWQETLGYSEDDMSTLSIVDIIHPESKIQGENVFECLKSGGALTHVEVIFIAKDGRKISTEGNVNCIFNNDVPVAIRGIFRDITEHKRVEEALQERERRLTATLKSIDDAVITTDNNGAITFLNPIAEMLTGWKQEEALGKDIVFKTISEEIHPPVEGPVKKTLREDIVIKLTDHAFLIARDGTEIPIEYSGAPIKDEKGYVRGVVLVIQDITERKRAEEELKKHRDHLEVLVQKRTAELTAANEQLRWEITERERAEEALRQYNRELAFLNHMSDLFQACRTQEEMCSVLASVCKQLFPSDIGFLYMLNDSQTHLEVVASWGNPLPHVQVCSVNDCQALRQNTVYCIRYPDAGPLCSHLYTFPNNGYLCAPISTSDETLGILSLCFGQYESSDSDDEQTRIIELKQLVVTRVVRHYALSLANLRLRETLRMEAIRDPLTGLYNRRYMEESLEQEAQRAKRRNTSVGIIMLDIDHFKRFNDTYGHKIGDIVLHELGVVLQKNTRREDIACRYGGEEFLLILPEVSLDVAGQRAEELRLRVENLQIRYQDKTFHITISLGVAVLSGHGFNVKDAVSAADVALYQAKERGRNQVVVASS
jgi:diguanylate cyclase (GGDEF)-like protein/PAS domain S-box-containing protein